MTTFSKITRNGQITLSASIRKKLGLEEGDLIEIKIVQDKAVLTPKRLVDKDQAYFWSKEWQKAEIQASEDIKAGRTRIFNTAEELFEELDK
jgi:AbrB family looped-hinge helix DNA binding protein